MDGTQETVGRGPSYRLALIAVIILSVLFVGAVIGLAIGFMRQYQIYRGGGTRQEAPLVLDLAPGARIVSAETAEGRLIVHVATPQGSEVEVVDLKTGKPVARVRSGTP